MKQTNPKIQILEATQYRSIDLKAESKGLITLRKSGKNALRYHEICMGFDIETTTLDNRRGYMYHWQLSINNYVILGRRWIEFRQVIDWIRQELALRRNTRIIIWIANEGFEFQFIRKQFNFTRVFAKDLRQPLVAIIDDCIEFRDCLAISGGSLAQLAKDYTETQKLVGDLDYKKNRSYKTPLTEQEKAYCINDVVILSEWAEYMFDTYMKPQKWLPVTKTGIIRKQVKDNVTDRIKNAIYITYPDRTFYDIMMKWVFRGGFVHANICRTDIMQYDIGSVDFTSSYPARMFMSYMPRSRFIPCRGDPLEVMKDHCVIMRITFHNIRSTTPHTIESKSKCYGLHGELIDNGRVRRAEWMSVWLTELDYRLYTLFYEWDDIIIHEAFQAVRGPLPRYILEPLSKAYIAKNELKKAGKSGTPEYVIAKGAVNSFYGLLVQKMVMQEIIYNNELNEWETDGNSFDYIKNVHHAYTLPQWGVWITAAARYELLTTVYKIEQESKALHTTGPYQGDVLYCDTDSIKMVNYDTHKHIIEEYNRECAEKMKQACVRYNLPLEHFHDLGQFDVEYQHAPKGKYLGSKRYITTKEDGHTEVTVAGLPKSALIDYCEKHNLDIYDTFRDAMSLDVGISLKMACKYNDEPHEDMVDGVKMMELSSCGIYDVSFTLRLDQLYKLQIEAFKAEGFRYEARIY